ncbi:MAG TPA: hypothetical protein VFV34_04240 [Blastocatellia bacterium]|nr:hypothetical protein [Blastocatellia bacterium]
MKRSSLSVPRRAEGILAPVALLAAIAGITMLLGVAGAETVGRVSDQPIGAEHLSREPAQVNCLPEGWKPTDVVSYKSGGKSPARNVTVEDKLTELKAHCRQGKLLDGKGREIRFFRFSCFGNPPENYEEIMQKERTELEKLQRVYTVIVPECDPRIS